MKPLWPEPERRHLGAHQADAFDGQTFVWQKVIRPASLRSDW